jgi:hypothetical protein
MLQHHWKTILSVALTVGFVALLVVFGGAVKSPQEEKNAAQQGTENVEPETLGMVVQGRVTAITEKAITFTETARNGELVNSGESRIAVVEETTSFARVFPPEIVPGGPTIPRRESAALNNIRAKDTIAVHAFEEIDDKSSFSARMIELIVKQ